MRPGFIPPDASSLANRTMFVIGDVHLHVGSTPQLVADLHRVLEQIQGHDPRACLVFNGDLFDLDRIGHERAGGVGEEQVAARIEQVLDAFPRVTHALASHLTNGGLLVFVAGNHDAEILLPRARQVLCEHLAAGGDNGRLYTVERLSLAELLIEHGHQSDPDCAFYPDTYTAIRKGRLSAFPLASLLTRFFLTRNPRFEGLGDHYSTPLTVVLRIIRDYKFDSVAMILGYPIASVRIVWQAILARVRGDAPAGARSALTMSSPWVVARRLYLDRYFGFLAALVTLVCISSGLFGHIWWWIFGSISAYLVIPPFRRKAFKERDVRGCATSAASHIRNGVKTVILGHTHRAFVSLIDGCTYANHGSFSQPAICENATLPPNESPPPLSGSSSHLARPYLAVTMDPPGCELCMLPTSDCPPINQVVEPTHACE